MSRVFVSPLATPFHSLVSIFPIPSRYISIFRAPPPRYFSPSLSVAVTALASIAFIVIAVMIGVQRLHDLGWSGWLWLLNFVPFVGSVFGILMLVLPGSTGANRYGPPPPANSTGVKVLASLIILLPIVGIIAAIALPSYQGYLERANYDGGASAPADPYTTDEQAAAAAAEADEAATTAAEAMEDDDQQ